MEGEKHSKADLNSKYVDGCTEEQCGRFSWGVPDYEELHSSICELVSYHSEMFSKTSATSLTRGSGALGSDRGSRIAAANKRACKTQRRRNAAVNGTKRRFMNMDCRQSPSQKRRAQSRQSRPAKALNDIESCRRHRQFPPLNRSVCGCYRWHSDCAQAHASDKERGREYTENQSVDLSGREKASVPANARSAPPADTSANAEALRQGAQNG
jgi:hypothetical protein